MNSKFLKPGKPMLKNRVKIKNDATKLELERHKVNSYSGFPGLNTFDNELNLVKLDFAEYNFFCCLNLTGLIK